MDAPENKTIGHRITRWDLFKVFLASFFMQAVWNFRSLISIGFSVCFFPVLGKLCSSPEAKRNFFHRHLKFFNAHPYFASFALGVSIRMEELRAAGQPNMPETLDRLKDLLISPLGAVGDRLFWATIKPASLIFGMVGILLVPQVWMKVAVIVLVFFIYNVPHFYYRYVGIIEGYYHPMEIHKFIGQDRFSKLRKRFVYLLFLSLAVLVVVYSLRLFQIRPGLVIVFLASALYCLIFNRITQNFYVASLATFLFFLAAGVLFF